MKAMKMSREHSSASRCLLVWSLTGLAAGGALAVLVPLARPRPGAGFDELLTAGSAVALSGCLLWAWLAASVVVVDAFRGTTTDWTGCPVWFRRVVLLGCGAVLVGAPVAAHADPTAGQPPQPVDDSTPAVSALREVADDHRLDGVPLPDLPTTPPEVAPSPSLAAPERRRQHAPSGAQQQRPPAPRPKQAPEPPPEPPASRRTQSPAVPEAAEPPVPAAPAAAPGRPNRPEHTTVVAPGDSLWAIAARVLPPSATAAEVDRAWRTLWHRNRSVIGPDPDLISPGQRLDLTSVLTTPPQEDR